MSIFAVVAAPRSRTAWLSVFLSHGRDSICQHDMLRKGPPEAWQRILRDGYHQHHGFTDTAAGNMEHELHTTGLLDGPVLVVRRPRFEIVDSLERAGISTAKLGPMLDEAEAGLDRIARRRNALVVSHDSISRRLPEIWQHCLPMLPFDSVRASELDRLNIQASRDRFLDGLWPGWKE